MALNANRLFDDIVKSIEEKITESEQYKEIQKDVISKKEFISEEEFKSLVPKYKMDEQQKAMWSGITEALVAHIIDNLEIVGIESRLKDPKVETNVKTNVETKVSVNCTGGGGSCSGTGVGTGEGTGKGEVVNPESLQSNPGTGLVR